jgi:NADH-quinone oxidoreductase subunit N
MLSHTLQTLRTFMHGDGALLLPELELLLFAVGILLMDFWVTQKDKYWSPALALAGSAFSGSTLWMLRGRVLQSGDLIGVNETLVVDAYFIFFSAIFLIAIALVTLLSMNYPRVSAARQGRYYALLLMAGASMMVLISAVDLVVLFLALEALAIASYFLASSPGFTMRPRPSAVPFIFSSALGSALLAYGFSILYGLSGATNIGKIAAALTRRHNVAKVIALSRQSSSPGTQMYQLLQTRLPEALHLHPYVLQALPVAAVALILLGMYLKFYATSLRTPRETSGANISHPVVLYLAGPCVIAMLAFLLRFLVTVFADSQPIWSRFVAVLAFVLLICGGIASLRQTSPLGVLRAASIAQIGNVLLALVAANEGAFTAITYYLFTYLFILAGALAVLVVVQKNSSNPDSEVDGLRGRNPIMALLLIIFMISLAGFPPTAGAFGRYLVFHALVETRHRYLAWSAAIVALPLAYSYLRIAVRAWRGLGSGDAADPNREAPAPISLGAPEAIVLGICVFVSLAAGLYPEPFTRMAHYAFGQ